MLHFCKIKQKERKQKLREGTQSYLQQWSLASSTPFPSSVKKRKEGRRKEENHTLERKAQLLLTQLGNSY